MLGKFVFARLRETKFILFISNALFYSLLKDVAKDRRKNFGSGTEGQLTSLLYEMMRSQ
ncbi:MAG: hypothetical protein V7K25_28645 [Nostoc sp.]|uniref:hypothetical protein n=1 Tax=Nostoc sp. TaxID=1180 RepID=UPI002FF8A955